MRHMNTRDTLSAFSEWLDSEGLTVAPATTAKVRDNRSHDDLATAFIQHWEADERGALLAGRDRDDPLLGLATTKQLIDELAARADVAATIGERWPSYKTAGDDEREDEPTPIHVTPVTAQVCYDLLLLVAPTEDVMHEVQRQAMPLLRSVSQRTRNMIATWAGAVHLEASDNEVDVPPMPKIVETFGFRS